MKENMKYASFTTDDFITDQHFRQWVLGPDSKPALFWEEFMKRYPGKSREILAAYHFLLAMKGEVEKDFSSIENEDQVFEKIKSQINLQQKVPRWQLGWQAWLAAASILLILGLFFLKKNTRDNRFSYENLLQSSDQLLDERKNESGVAMTITLDDGSVVTLKPGSRISYSRSLNRDGERKVYLSGEAFFQVTRNPAKPFLVFSEEIVTKVLGTSFTVRAYESDKNITVSVKTGSVNVYKALSRDAGDKEVAGLVLKPNQRAVYSEKAGALRRTLVEQPEMLVRPEKSSLSFDDVPVRDIFELMEKSYGVTIIADQSIFGNCRLTTTLNDEHLFTKLDIVCGGIGATYTIKDARIIIQGKGCL